MLPMTAPLAFCLMSSSEQRGAVTRVPAPRYQLNRRGRQALFSFDCFSYGIGNHTMSVWNAMAR
jgi:hypothetical protein